MRASLIGLIARMTVREGNVNSDESVAWHAHREAEALSDASLINKLAERVQHESKPDSRKAAYFILGKLARSFPHRNVPHFSWPKRRRRRTSTYSQRCSMLWDISPSPAISI